MPFDIQSTIIAKTHQKMTSQRQQRFEKMMDRLPEVKNAYLEAELLLDATARTDVPKLSPEDLDKVRGKRSSIKKECTCHLNSTPGPCAQ